jgi:putative transcriptional regulator
MYNRVGTEGGRLMAIKVHLSRLMGERRLKISDLAKMTGLHRNGLTQLYNEETNGIKFDTLEKICRALNCDISDLLEIVDEPKKEDEK